MRGGAGRSVSAPRGSSRRGLQSRGISKSSTIPPPPRACESITSGEVAERRPEAAEEHLSDGLPARKGQASVSGKGGALKAVAVSRLDGRAAEVGKTHNEDRPGAGNWRSTVLRPSPLVIPGRQVQSKKSIAGAGKLGADLRGKTQRAQTSSSVRKDAHSKSRAGPLQKASSLKDRISGGTALKGGKAGAAHGMSRSPETTTQRRRVPFDPSTPDSLGSTGLRCFLWLPSRPSCSCAFSLWTELPLEHAVTPDQQCWTRTRHIATTWHLPCASKFRSRPLQREGAIK